MLSVLILSAYALFESGYRDQFFMREQNEAVEQARRGMRVMIKEMREAADGDNGAYPLELADDYELIFYSDIDVDAITERVRYFLENDQLKKGVTKPIGSPLVYDPDDEKVVNIVDFVVNAGEGEPVFSYYNGDYPGDVVYNPLDTPAALVDVQLVKVYLLVNVNPLKVPDNVALTSFVQMRNLKDNL